ncbi:MAG: flippase-like domain-containing protein [Candidatus Hodarchaeales archaeon]
MKFNAIRIGIFGIMLSISIIFIFSIIFEVDILTTIKKMIPAFILAAVFSIGRLFIQGIRFHIFLKKFGQNYTQNIFSSIYIRAGSEFAALTFLPYLGDEAVRIALLSWNGMNSGRATWVAYLELLFDSLLGGILSFIAATYALFLGAIPLAIFLFIMSIPILIFFSSTLFLSVKKDLHLPNSFSKLIKKLFGENRGKKIVDFSNNTITVFSDVAKHFLKRSSLKIAVVGIVLTLLIVLLPSLALYVIFNYLGSSISILESILATNAATTLGLIPITLGGSGLTEFGIDLYTMNVFGISNWNAILGWRISTYLIPLTFSTIALIIILIKLRKK